MQNPSFDAIARRSIADLTPQSFAEDYQQHGIPVVITEALNPEWDWTLDYLRQQLGDQEFVLRFYGQERYEQDKRQWTSIGSGVPPQSKPFSTYAQLLQTHEAHEQDVYMAKCPLHNTPLAQTEALHTIQDRLSGLGLQPASTLNLWVGPGGHRECLHYDPSDGTLIQLHGCKRVILFPPSQTANLYPFPFYVHLRHGMKLRSWFSQVYPDRPDFAAFPRLQTALRHKYDFILNPGEILYIPAGWWHEVVALGDEMVCSVNRFWRVYPTPRAVLSWQRWRAYLGSACAIPNTIARLVAASFNPKPKQKFKEILQMF